MERRGPPGWPGERANRDQRCEEQRDLDRVDGDVASGGGHQGSGQTCHPPPGRTPPSRMSPPSATAVPAAEAWTAPQMPSVSPTWPGWAVAIAAVKVQCAKSPAPSPISVTPMAKSVALWNGAANTTKLKAARPTMAPTPARRYGSVPRPNSHAAVPNPVNPPTASSAVMAVVAPTGSPRTRPP